MLCSLIFGPRPKFLVEDGGYMPRRGTPGAAAYDLYAPYPFNIGRNKSVIVDFRIRCSFRRGWVAQVWDRSGLGAKNIHRFAGVIDSDYRGEWKAVVHNFSDKLMFIEHGAAVVQVLFVPCFMGRVREVTKLDETERGEGRMGSTDVQVPSCLRLRRVDS